MRIILGFFGLTRSLRYTASAISKSIEDPLVALGVPVLKLGDFNLPDLIFNPRSNELGVLPDPTESRLLNLHTVRLHRQEDSDIGDVLEVIKAFPDRFGDQYRSATNLCHQLNSLRRLWTLIQTYGVKQNDIILFMRPDLIYLDPVNAARDIFPLLRNEVDIVVPAWQSWGGTNDRFAFCTPAAAEIYATRFDGIIEACLTMNGLHAESYLHAIITESGLRVGFTNLRAARVRANGTVADFDRVMLDQCLMDTMASPLAANITVLTPSCLT
jgi:hypothetical protein